MIDLAALMVRQDVLDGAIRKIYNRIDDIDALHTLIVRCINRGESKQVAANLNQFFSSGSLLSVER
jgi:phosphate uptake regulator